MRFTALFIVVMASVASAPAILAQALVTAPFLSDKATVYDRQVTTAYTGMQLAARRAPSNNKYVTMGANVSTGGEVDISVMPLGGAYVGAAAAAPAGLGSAPPPANSILDQPGMTLISPLQP